MKHEYEQRRADAMIEADTGVLEFCSPALPAYGRRHIWMLFTQGRECRAREFMEDFNPLLWLILHGFV